jgi:hypothetical protein
MYECTHDSTVKCSRGLSEVKCIRDKAGDFSAQPTDISFGDLQRSKRKFPGFHGGPLSMMIQK